MLSRTARKKGLVYPLKPAKNPDSDRDYRVDRNPPVSRGVTRTGTVARP